MNLKGRHVLADITTSEDIDDDHFVDLCHRAVEVSGMEVVDFTRHLFKPQGTTAIWILAESRPTHFPRGKILLSRVLHLWRLWKADGSNTCTGGLSACR